MSDAAIKLDMPELSGNSAVARGGVNPGNADREQIKREAYAEGLEQGRLRGEQLGRQQAEKELQTFRQMMAHLHQPLIDLDNQILESLAALAVRLAGQLMHRELELEPCRLIPVIASAIEQLPLNNDPPRVLLNPQEVELIASAQTDDIDTSRWVLAADPTIQPGECHVSVGLSRIDLGLDARLGNLLATLLAEDAPIPG